MEPRRDDGEDTPGQRWSAPQWSPVVMTGKTPVNAKMAEIIEPVAAMEPRRDDGEDRGLKGPQWSPVVMTGKTRTSVPPMRRRNGAPS